MKNAEEYLTGANRQYRHNNSDEFIHGYSVIKTRELVNALLIKLNRAEVKAHKWKCKAIEREKKLSKFLEDKPELSSWSNS